MFQSLSAFISHVSPPPPVLPYFYQADAFAAYMVVAMISKPPLMNIRNMNAVNRNGIAGYSSSLDVGSGARGRGVSYHPMTDILTQAIKDATKAS